MGIVGYIIVMIISAAVSYATRPKPTRPTAAAFEDFDFPQAKEGTPQIVVFGDVWIDGWTVLGLGNYRVEEIRKG